MRSGSTSLPLRARPLHRHATSAGIRGSHNVTATCSTAIVIAGNPPASFHFTRRSYSLRDAAPHYPGHPRACRRRNSQSSAAAVHPQCSQHVPAAPRRQSLLAVRALRSWAGCPGAPHARIHPGAQTAGQAARACAMESGLNPRRGRQASDKLAGKRVHDAADGCSRCFARPLTLSAALGARGCQLAARNATQRLP
jgi:hypothetical protein